MRVLFLEPYRGGSHKAFLDGWSAHSRHAWTVLGLPPYKWKWRMRHAAATFADDAAARVARGERWDAVVCSDMLDLASFRGLAPAAVRDLPAVAYFHENQLTYPVRCEEERDYHYGFTNMTTALAARAVWFNSAWHRDSFLDALARVLRRMPDHQPLDAPERIRARSAVQPQGIAPAAAREARAPGPLRILWAARWEHDKDPDTFFAALDRLRDGGTPFRVSVVGERFRDVPPVFARARERFAGQVDRWGYQEARADYERALLDADVVVSTARHEFFGISIVEAVAAGAFPVVPRRLAYPEVLAADANPDFFYDDGAPGLARRLAALAARVEAGDLWDGDAKRGRRTVAPYLWDALAPVLDDALPR
jgi:glycosyltransferase involved in cell wall biosynthesis